MPNPLILKKIEIQNFLGFPDNMGYPDPGGWRG